MNYVVLIESINISQTIHELQVTQWPMYHQQPYNSLIKMIKHPCIVNFYYSSPEQVGAIIIKNQLSTREIPEMPGDN